MPKVELINILLVHLPIRDRALCLKFLEKGDFNSIKEIVDSLIFKIKRNNKSESPNAKYDGLDLNNLYILKAEVDLYVTLLELPNINDNEEEY